MPGNYNFRWKYLTRSLQASWGKISRSHVDRIVDLVTRYLNFTFKSVLSVVTFRDKPWKNLKIALDKKVDDSHEDLDKLLQDEHGHPITYNHYYTDKIQKARQGKMPTSSP
ncbi:Dynamin [Penicillium subrubescens]|uniref:Uncharacterized protein n=1 Tax=Penicillium subrubescens TaxID=1316194 RepID=A0A1Q5TK50_9EURO|nr:Dynamin [Penicillium subrubescens]KAJ5890335.1 Dynamin [Penicillium subrubescens]OKP00598.1 hypothetical protein PENSUB_7743 [Penicillium subrubescens]